MPTWNIVLTAEQSQLVEWLVGSAEALNDHLRALTEEALRMDDG